MEKIDYKKKYSSLYRPGAKEPSIVYVPALRFLAIDGAGDPNGEEFQSAVGAIYSLAYTIKFWPKKHQAPAGYLEYNVPPLEALWWVDGQDRGNMNMDTPRVNWRWRVMIIQPEFVTQKLLDEARAEAAAKKPNPSLSKAGLIDFLEGEAVQLMHIGPYAEELPSIQRIDDYMRLYGYESNGRHHEIYMGDPRRTAPERLKTILRHPVKKIPGRPAPRKRPLVGASLSR